MTLFHNEEKPCIGANLFISRLSKPSFAVLTCPIIGLGIKLNCKWDHSINPDWFQKKGHWHKQLNQVMISIKKNNNNKQDMLLLFWIVADWPILSSLSSSFLLVLSTRLPLLDLHSRLALWKGLIFLWMKQIGGRRMRILSEWYILCYWQWHRCCPRVW